MPTDRPTTKALRASYQHLGSVPAVAAELGVAFETARRWLRQAGVELQGKGRPSPSASRLENVELTNRYAAGESIAAIGQALDVSPATVRARLINAGVELRPRPGWKY